MCRDDDAGNMCRGRTIISWASSSRLKVGDSLDRALTAYGAVIQNANTNTNTDINTETVRSTNTNRAQGGQFLRQGHYGPDCRWYCNSKC